MPRALRPFVPLIVRPVDPRPALTSEAGLNGARAVGARDADEAAYLATIVKTEA